LVDAAVTDFRVVADEAGLKLTAAIATDPLTVRGEVVYLKRVVDNLLTNAVKFTSEGGQVAVSLSRQDDQAVLQVVDSGIGIPPEEQDLIFERFYRAGESRRRNLRGTGLGLSLVKEIVEAHGGAVDVKSEVDTGTIFTVMLPVCVD
jgi:signal transduction histidine kinase